MSFFNVCFTLPPFKSFNIWLCCQASFHHYLKILDPSGSSEYQESMCGIFHSPVEVQPCGEHMVDIADYTGAHAVGAIFVGIQQKL